MDRTESDAGTLLLANRFMSRATDWMIMLLADGHNDCENVGQAMSALRDPDV